MKLPIEILYNRLNSPIYCRRDYSSWPCRGRSIAEAGEIINAFTSNSANPHHAYGMFLRRYAVEVPASEQMTLIKQLRERTSAPIKDVKSSLVDCNWDIGKFDSLPLFFSSLVLFYNLQNLTI